MKQSILGLDARYTVATETVQLELCGYPTAQYVARFCDEFISSHETKVAAQDACRAYEIKGMEMFS